MNIQVEPAGQFAGSRLLLMKGIHPGARLSGQVMAVFAPGRSLILFGKIPVIALVPPEILPGMRIRVQVSSVKPRLMMRLIGWEPTERTEAPVENERLPGPMFLTRTGAAFKKGLLRAGRRQMLKLIRVFEPAVATKQLRRFSRGETAEEPKEATRQLGFTRLSSAPGKEEERFITIPFVFRLADERAEGEIRLRSKEGGRIRRTDDIIHLAMLLHLQSLGSVMIEAYLNHRSNAVGCMINVERKEILPIIEELLPALAARLGELGFFVEKLNCRHQKGLTEGWRPSPAGNPVSRASWVDILA